MEKELKRKTSERMETVISSLKREFSSIRTGRASLSLLDDIMVDYYSNPTPLTQLASLSVPDPRQILIQPWEEKIISDIEKAIMKSDLGLTPLNDGRVIRINIPALTEERRRHLVRVVSKKAEEARVAIRNIRRDSNEELKKQGRLEHISEDDVKRIHDEVQRLTDSFIKKIDEILQHKEAEIMEV